MAVEFIDALTVHELILGDISGAAVMRVNGPQNYGLIGISGGKIVWFNGTTWKTVTDG